MLILTEYGRPYILESRTGPVIPKEFWSLDSAIQDLVLTPLVRLLESTGPVIDFEIDGYGFSVPGSWFILVTDPETNTLDTVPAYSCHFHHYHAFLLQEDCQAIDAKPIVPVNFDTNRPYISPTIDKSAFVGHPVGSCPASKKFSLAFISPLDVINRQDYEMIGPEFLC